jgi:hypothetical protein
MHLPKIRPSKLHHLYKAELWCPCICPAVCLVCDGTIRNCCATNLESERLTQRFVVVPAHPASGFIIQNLGSRLNLAILQVEKKP